MASVALPKFAGKVLVCEIAAIYGRNFGAPDSGHCGNIRNLLTWTAAIDGRPPSRQDHSRREPSDIGDRPCSNVRRQNPTLTATGAKIFRN
jgi:hypothetical protein